MKEKYNSLKISALSLICVSYQDEPENDEHAYCKPLNFYKSLILLHPHML